MQGILGPLLGLTLATVADATDKLHEEANAYYEQSITWLWLSHAATRCSAERQRYPAKGNCIALLVIAGHLTLSGFFVYIVVILRRKMTVW